MVHPASSSFAAELEFAQIIIIIVVVTVMVVVIVCLLNHYKVSTRSFINRPSQSRRQEDRLQQVSEGPRLLGAAQASGPLARAPRVRPGAREGPQNRTASRVSHCCSEYGKLSIEGHYTCGKACAS